ncbi:PREDICTED: espin-like protein [Gekko japonicus]|uniref:Espin-like protein n=1 Tax=Gekko japonicus TaxID=146911 RepID=A0ABM1L8L0_GEKJA|nr:PREDICTED: espin-like protein [Gekko japonicus]
MGDHRAIKAVKAGDLTTLEQLHIDGALGQNITDCLGAGLVHHASRAGRLECLKFLVLQAKLPGNQRANNGATPAHDAAAVGNLAELQWLIKDGEYSMQEEDASGASPLHLAARFGHSEVVKWLVQAGYNTASETQEGAIPAHYAAAKGSLTCLKLLVATDCSCMNKQTRSGATLLYLACQEGHLHIVQFLVKDCAANVHLRAHDGMTVLHAAASSGHYAVVIWLATFTDINLGAQDEEGATALHFAAREGHTTIVDRLFLMGAEVVLDHWGGTPLHDAAENGQLKCCQMLISHQVDPGIHDRDGYTARDLAEYNGHRQCARYLQEVEKMVIEILAQGEKREKTEVKIPSTLLVMLEELGASDIDALVPTHDERGCSIPEWKRQVMVRKLQAQLASEEGMSRKNKKGCALEQDDWQYSQAHNAILGPYGELLTEDDLLYLENQIEKLQMRKKCQEYESELGRLTEELQTVLPTPIVNITVNSQFLQQGSEENSQELPAWCSHMSGVVKSMSLLLNNINGMKKEENERLAPQVLPKSRKNDVMSGGSAKREILECGVSVKNLRGSFEKRALLGQHKPFELQGLKAMPWEHGTGKERSPQMLSYVCEGKKKILCEDHESGDMENASDSGISCEEATSEVTGSPVSIAESSVLRKERIVLLFLSHWKKSAYTPSLKFMARKTVKASDPAKVGLVDIMAEVKKQQAPMQKPLVEMSKLGHLVRQRYAIKNLIDRWKDIISLVPSRQIRRLSHQHTVYSPEQFLPYVNGKPADYNSLTLDLFMLGYFHILELDLSPEERKRRHLLCFEVFDHLGRHRWETVRAFHKAVIDEIVAGKRGWKDSFEDIKTRFFSNSVNNIELKTSSVERNLKSESSNSVVLEQGDGVPRKCFELGSFSNDEICKYIERSFAFWKEKEAEMFSVEGSGHPLH